MPASRGWEVRVDGLGAGLAYDVCLLKSAREGGAAQNRAGHGQHRGDSPRIQSTGCAVRPVLQHV